MRSRGIHLWAAVVAILIVGLAPAFAAFSDSDGASHTLSTGTLSPPTGLAAGAGSCTILVNDKIVLSWTASPSTNADDQRILRATNPAGPWTQVAALPIANTSYTSGGLSFSTTYYWKIRVVLANWTTESAVVSRTTRSALCL